MKQNDRMFHCCIFMRGRHRHMVIGFTTICAISAYYQLKLSVRILLKEWCVLDTTLCVKVYQ